MIETTLAAVLLDDAAVAALASTRVEPMENKTGQLPAVVYQRISSTPEVTLAGDAGLDAVRIQIASWAKTYAESKALSTAVRAAVTSSALLKAVTEMEMDTRDPVTREYGSIIDFRIWQ